MSDDGAACCGQNDDKWVDSLWTSHRATRTVELSTIGTQAMCEFSAAFYTS